MFTCCIRYFVDPAKRDELEEYARAWITLIEKYGGSHHGNFVPGRESDDMPQATFSFPGLGLDGPPDVAWALFSFPDVAAYEHFRRAVADDPLCHSTTARFQETKCFTRYERTFLKPILRD